MLSASSSSDSTVSDGIRKLIVFSALMIWLPSYAIIRCITMYCNARTCSRFSLDIRGRWDSLSCCRLRGLSDGRPQIARDVCPGTWLLRGRRSRHFAHQLVDVSFAILECRHPQIVRGHWRDQPRGRHDLHSMSHQPLVARLNIRHAEIENR